MVKYLPSPHTPPVYLEGNTPPGEVMGWMAGKGVGGGVRGGGPTLTTFYPHISDPLRVGDNIST